MVTPHILMMLGAGIGLIAARTMLATANELETPIAAVDSMI
jgi:hypothetical protein